MSMDMNHCRRSASRLAIVAAVLAAAAFAVPAAMAAKAKPAKAAAPQRPNIVFILTDDLDYRLYTDTAGLAPLLNEQGATFGNDFVSLPLCCPSRTTILRGQYAHNTGLFTNHPPEGGFFKAHTSGLETSTIATWLQAAGYRTALVGKYLNGYGKGADSKQWIPPGWSDWIVPNAGNPYKQFKYSLNENGKTSAHGKDAADYGTDVLAAKANDFIRSSAGKPFFLYLATYAPHTPSIPPPRYPESAQKPVPTTRSFNEADVSDKPQWVQNLPPLKPKAIEHMQVLERRRRASMLAVVDLVRSVIETLKATSQLDNTYIFFTSDNGLHFGQHRLPIGKDTAYEEDIHMPLIVRGPGIAPGSRIGALVANVDFAPTFADIAGASVPDFVDGRSMLPLFKGATPPDWRKAILLEHGGDSLGPDNADDGLSEPRDGDGAGSSAAPVYAGLRSLTHTYVEYDNGERELYDMDRDPEQLDNVYSKADPALKKSLSAMLASLRSARGEGLRRAEQQ